jgi:hypothetical protein
MAQATNKNGGCGCNPALRTKQVGKGKPAGEDWSPIVQDLLRESAKRAREHLKAQDDPGEGEIEVPVRITAFFRYGFKGKRLMDKGLVGCVCTNDGTVCVCRGQCDFDACCDVDAGTSGPIVAKK